MAWITLLVINAHREWEQAAAPAYRLNRVWWFNQPPSQMQASEDLGDSNWAKLFTFTAEMDQTLTECAWEHSAAGSLTHQVQYKPKSCRSFPGGHWAQSGFSLGLCFLATLAEEPSSVQPWNVWPSLWFILAVAVIMSCCVHNFTAQLYSM